MRYLIDYGCYLVEYSFEEITQKIEFRSARFSKQQFGNDFVLVKRY